MTVKDKMKFKEFLSINLHGKKEERRNYGNKINQDETQMDE